MRTICLYFQVHQPFRFRRYRFFDIGNEHYYYDDYSNESILRKVADKAYLPANKIMLDLIRKFDGKFKFAMSISGIAIDQMELYAPDVLESFRELARTGCVEFLAETNAHSLVALKDEQEFSSQVKEHIGKIQKHFGQTPRVFRNTELIYSDEIGAMVSRMGFQAMLTEGAKHVLGWKSPNYLYCNAIDPKLKVLLKNFKLSDDVAFRFSNKGWEEYPLTAGKYVSWLKRIGKDEETVNLFMDYETFGEHQWEETGIFEFLKALPEAVFGSSDFTFSTPSEVAEKLQVVSAVQVPYPISWADEERDLTAWLGNELQEEAFNRLYDLGDKIKLVEDPVLKNDWDYLQVSDHFYYMCTKFFSDGAVHSYFNPYDTPYDAFINYMNVLNDFTLRVNAAVPQTGVEQEISNLTGIIEEKDKVISKYEKELYELNKQLLLLSGKEQKDVAIKAPDRKPAAKESAARQPVTSKSTAGKSAEKKTVAEKSAAKKPAAAKTTTRKPAAENKAAKKAVKKKPTASTAAKVTPAGKVSGGNPRASSGKKPTTGRKTARKLKA
jgi:alpha-amylase